MNKVLLYFFTVLFFTISVNSQDKLTSKKSQGSNLTPSTIQSIQKTGYARCLTVENEIELQQKYPSRASTEEFEQMLAPIIARIKADRIAGRNTQVIYNIPVVVHIIHNGDPINTNGTAGNENISDAQALSQINVMNQDYRMLVGTPGATNSTGAAVDVEINFCMAQTDPNGNATNGLDRQNITPYSNADTPATVDDWELKSDVETMKTNTQWDPTKYLNMWTFKPGGLSLNQGGLGGLLGYAQFPSNSGLSGLNSNGGAADTDGVVAAYDAFGTIADADSSFVLNNTYNLGRTMTHEVGHWLGLRHIWGDSSTCSNDDYCADTPDADTAHYDCATYDTCTSDGLGNDQVQNYMDYSNDSCMDTFTQNQKDRMQAVMAVSPRRVELNSSTVCNSPTAPYFGLINTNGNQSSCAANDTVFDFSYTQYNGFNENTTFTAVGNPTGSSISIAPSSLNANGNFTVTVSNLAGVTNGSYPISVTGTSPSMSQSVNVTLTIGLCSSVSNTSYQTSTTLVNIGTINNSSAKPSGYSDYTALSTDVIVGQSYPLIVNANTDGAYNIQTKVWIDWNQNCVFDIATEEYDLGSAFNVSNGPTSLSPLNIVPPATAMTGTTMMRVSTKYTASLGTDYPTPCENAADGEVEDYSLNVIGAPLGINNSDFTLFNIYPNPTKGSVNVILSSNDDVKIKLIDIQGRTIYSKLINNNSSIFNKNINFGNITTGVYFLKINSGTKKATKKLIIQ